MTVAYVGAHTKKENDPQLERSLTWSLNKARSNKIKSKRSHRHKPPSMCIRVACRA